MRYHRTFGLDAEQLDELEARIQDILPDPWDKGTGRPKSLSLREAIMVTLLYKRQNIIEEVIADLFGVSQGTVSEIITEFTLLIAQATEEFRPDAEEAKQMTRGTASAGRWHVVAMLVMGARSRDVGREI